MRKIVIFALLSLICTGISAQEIQCKVSVNSEQIQGSNKEVFTTLQTAIEEYINQNRWTNLTFSEKERIDCSMLIVVNSVSENLFSCEMTLQSRRPVFGTSYNTPVMNFVDQNFNFTYQEFDRIEWQQNTFTTNLTAMLAFYCYLIIGQDMDTYQRLGGTPFFTICEEIVSTCQSASMESSESKGWRAFDSNRNRYALINNLKDEAFRPFREYVYEYHRLGLDMMAENVANGRARIAGGIEVMKTCYNARPATYIINTYLDAKADELTNIFAQGTSDEKKKVYDILTAIDPTRSNIYDKINK